MKKLLKILCCISLIMIVGCSSQEAERKDLEVVESGYSQSSDKEYAYYGVGIKNSNEDVSVEYPTYNVTLYDKDGKVISTEEQTLDHISANDTVYFGFVLDSKGKAINKMEVKINTDEENYVESEYLKTDVFKISNTDKNSESITGEIENTSDKDCDQVAITLILKKDGKIVYGDTTYVDNLKSKNKQAFEFDGYDLPKYDKYEIHAQSW